MRLKTAVPAAILSIGFLMCTLPVYGTAEYAKKEKKSCTFCHAKAGSNKEEMNKNLKKAGTCYKENQHSLANCSAAK